jgi:ABC-type Fe3+/spermidine/putrescine transport system ATPase subunit
LLMFCPAQSERYFCSVPLNTAVSFEIGENVTIVTRLEMLKFSKEGPSNLRGVVRNVFFLGSLERYEIQVGDEELITFDDSNPTNLTAKGSNVHIEIVHGSAHVQKMSDHTIA